MTFEPIENAGFSFGLALHADITVAYFGYILLTALLGLPLSLLVCSLFVRLRLYMAHLTAGGISLARDEQKDAEQSPAGDVLKAAPEE